MINDAVKSLSCAVVLQAIADWRALCDGAKETKDRNFKELDEFFTKDCENYLSATDVPAKQIHNMLKQERKRSKVYTREPKS
jgi:hypothetical protein